jgi:hypothetical protein
MAEQLSSKGKTIEDVERWNVDLAEDETTVVVVAEVAGQGEDERFSAHFDWPLGSYFDYCVVERQFICALESLMSTLDAEKREWLAEHRGRYSGGQSQT